MDRSDCCVVTPSRATAAGLPGRLLLAAWREAAESGPAACLVVPRDGALVVGWLNRGLIDLLGTDVGQLVGRSLRELAEQDPEPIPGPRTSAAGPVPAQAGPWEQTGERSQQAGEQRSQQGGERSQQGGERSRQGGEQDPDRSPVDRGGQGGDEEGPATPGWARQATQLIRTGRSSGLVRVRHLDGRSLCAQVTITPVATEPAPLSSPVTVTPAGMIGQLPASDAPPAWLLMLEPTNDRLAEAQVALAVAEHRFDALAAAAPVGIFASDAGLRLGYVNESFIALAGRDAHALLGTGWLDAVHREDLQAIYTATQTVLSGTPVELAVRWITGDGRLRWLQLRLSPTTTPARAAGFIGTAEDVTKRRSWEEHLTYQAMHDPLTGLVNRRRLIEVLAEQLTSRRGRDRDFAVLFLDLDGFKAVNDTHGHDVGDRTLIEVARRMQRVARESDVLARVAGDEFVVVLRYISAAAEAEAAARRHLRALSEPFRIGRLELALSASVGVALPVAGETPDSLLQTADRVMYEAKAAGQGLYRLAVTPGTGEPT